LRKHCEICKYYRSRSKEGGDCLKGSPRASCDGFRFVAWDCEGCDDFKLNKSALDIITY
jgi:hypothetical protein